jgi:hypothetical protein
MVQRLSFDQQHRRDESVEEFCRRLKFYFVVVIALFTHERYLHLAKAVRGPQVRHDPAA